MPGWLTDLSANKFNNTYFRDADNKGYAVDMSGDLVVRGQIRNDDTGAVDISGDLIVRGTPAVLNLIADTSDGSARSCQINLIRNTFSSDIYNDWRIENRGGFLHFDNFGQSQEANCVTFQNNGNVGIGTTSTNHKLHIDSTNSSVFFNINAFYLRFYNSGQLTIKQTTNVNTALKFNWRGNDKIYLENDGDIALMNFTGQHRTFVENILHTDASNNAGLIVCANRNTYISMSNEMKKGNKAIMQNESLPLVSLSTKSKDKSCFGVISESEDPELRGERVASVFFPTEKEEGDTRIFINSVGEGAIWVSNKNGPLESGDYITTSDIPGYGAKQDDDILHNYTVAKITMDCDFNPQLQPKEVILKEAAVDASGNYYYKNVFDANGEIQWTPETSNAGNIVQEYPYERRFLDVQGNRLTQEEYDTKLANGEQVFVAAYVGCTYHCG